MPVKFVAPKCPVCKIKQQASSETAWKKGNYACRCNSVDYSKTQKQRKEDPIELEDCQELINGEEVKFIVTGPPAIKKNSPRIVKMGKTISIRPSILYEVWASRALKQLSIQWYNSILSPIKGKVWMEAHYYRDTRRIADLSNLHEGIQDCLTTVGVWMDDSQIESHDGSRKHYDKDNPRIEITLRRYNDQT